MKGIYVPTGIEMVIFKYMITMPFMSETRIRLIITKAGITPEDKKLPMGKKKKLPYGKESEFHDLEEI